MLAFQTFSDDEPKVQRVFKDAQAELNGSSISSATTARIANRAAVAERIGWSVAERLARTVGKFCKCATSGNRLSDGAFDASVGQLSILWRKARRSKTVPTQAGDRGRAKAMWLAAYRIRQRKEASQMKLAGLRLDLVPWAKAISSTKLNEYWLGMACHVR